MTYSERNRRRSIRYPKSGAGPMPNRYRTVIIVLARYYDVALSHTEQKGEDAWLIVHISTWQSCQVLLYFLTDH